MQPTDGDGTAVATTVVRAWQGVPRAASLSHGVSRLAAIDLALLRVLRSGRSCPSAHATTSFTAGRLLSQLLPGQAPYEAAVAMALTRPHTGVHYPSDVLAGMALGTVLGQIGRR